MSVVLLWLQVKQLDKLEQYTVPANGDAAADGELGELSQKFYQAAVQVWCFIIVFYHIIISTEFMWIAGVHVTIYALNILNLIYDE